MPINLAIPHAHLFADRQGVKVLQKSDDFPEAWEEIAVRLVEGFGGRPEVAEVVNSLAVLPFDKKHTAVIQLADDGMDTRYHLLVLNRRLYHAISDPFEVADRFPPCWSFQSTLPELIWTPDPLPTRAVAEVAEILHHDGPLLLGATQALVDGARVVLRSPLPDPTTVQRIWKLLPFTTRNELALATFTWAVDRRFHLSVTPEPARPLPFGVLDAEMCRDLPEGRYELAVQIAAESDNQVELNRLFTRRSSADTLKLALILVGVMLLGLVMTKLLW